MLKLALIFGFLTLSNGALGKSLEWQRIELESTINSKYESAIAGVLSSNEFLVKTEVKYNDPGMPNFGDLNQSDFKVSDLDFDESKGDYIAFSKVGLEVPVVGKMHQKHQQQLKELYRYNESMDLFKNIESISVNIAMSDTVSKERQETARTIIKSLEFSVAGFTPKVDVRTLKIQVPAVVASDAGKENPGFKDFIELLGKFGNAIGLIFAVCLLGLLSYKLLKMYMEFMERIKGMETAPAAAPAPEKSEDRDEPMMMSAPGAGGEGAEQKPTFERFERLMALNEKQAAVLVKKWLKRDDDNARLMLTAVAQQLEPTALQTIFAEVSIEEREKWNSFIDGALSGNKLEKANILISEGVMKELVGGSFVEDHELVDLILGMNAELVKSYVLKGSEFAKILTNLLNPEMMSEILNELSIEEMDQVVAQSMEFTYEDLKGDLTKFKEDLRIHCGNTVNKPFNQKLLQIISEVSPEKEGTLYRHMAKECESYELVEVAKKWFPSDLVMDLPRSFVKIAMQNYPMDKKIPLLASLEEDRREELMSSFLEEGTNAMEMVKMELEALMEDEIQLQKLKKTKDSVWKEFLGYVRQALKADEEHQSDVEELVVGWVEKLKGNEEKVAAVA